MIIDFEDYHKFFRLFLLFIHEVPAFCETKMDFFRGKNKIFLLVLVNLLILFTKNK